MTFIAYLLSIFIAPLFGVVALIFLLPLLRIKLFLAFPQLLGWIEGISSGALQVWIISLIFKWLTDSHPHFIFLIFLIFITVFTLNEKINPGPTKFSFLAGSVLGLIIGWFNFI